MLLFHEYSKLLFQIRMSKIIYIIGILMFSRNDEANFIILKILKHENQILFHLIPLFHPLGFFFYNLIGNFKVILIISSKQR